MRSRAVPLLVLLLAGGLVAGLWAALADRSIPLGVPGEWEWSRLGPTVRPSGVRLAIALAGVALDGLFAALGARMLGRAGAGPAREAAWLAALVPVGVLVQLAVMTGAPVGYGLPKWVTLAMPGASGYYDVARGEADDLAGFLGRYDSWIAGQDALHIGTHPPGLFATTRAALALMDRAPGLARLVDAALPPDVRYGFRNFVRPLPRADRAAIALIGALTMVASVATAVPLYLLMRSSGQGPLASWSAACLWPVVPAAVLFQPAADAAFPLLATAALALAARATPRSAALAGIVLAVGMAFTLAFLAVGLIVGLALATAPATDPSATARAPARDRPRLPRPDPARLGGDRGGPVRHLVVEPAEPRRASTRSSPARISPGSRSTRSRRPSRSACRRRSGRSPGSRPAGRRGPAGSPCSTLALLTISGRSLSEVARLWLPFFPALIAAAGAGVARLGGGPIALGLTVASMGVQSLILEAFIQVVYPA